MQSDWKELIASLKSHGVEFLVVGAHALAFYARPRFTEDLDLFIRRSDENADRLTDALHDFGIPVNRSAVQRLIESEREMIVLGNAPVAVDLLNFLDGVDFDQAWSRRVEGNVLGVEVFLLSLQDYVATKKASARPKDIADLAILSEVTGETY